MLLGLTGRHSSGKDTVGAYLVECHGFTRVAFADALKEMAGQIGWNGRKEPPTLWERLRWMVWGGPAPMDGRWLLQHLGMGCREVFGADCWIGAAENRLVEHFAPCWNPYRDRVVVTDVRLPNEVAWIKRNGGLVVRVSRPSVLRDTPADRHVSEAGIDALAADIEVINDGTLDDLWAKAETVVANLKTIEAR